MRHGGIFITGCPRSGTTLLQSIVSSHSEIYTAPETSFFSRIIPRLGVDYGEPGRKIDQRCIEVIVKSFQEQTGIDLPTDFPDRGREYSAREVFEELLGGFNTERKPLWVEKTTLHARNLMAIRRFYPQARIVNMVRDPVACVGSMSAIKPTSISDLRIKYIGSLYEYAALWNDCVSAALGFPYQDHIMHVHYESLVESPEHTVKAVCEFLGVAYEKGMLESFHKAAKGIFSESSCPWQKGNLSPGLSKEPLYKWRKRLGVEKTWIIQKYTRKYSTMLGYYEENHSNKVMLILVFVLDQAKRLFSASRMELFVRRFVMRLIK